MMTEILEEKIAPVSFCPSEDPPRLPWNTTLEKPLSKYVNYGMVTVTSYEPNYYYYYH
jgi:hypothetical protein